MRPVITCDVSQGVSLFVYLSLACLDSRLPCTEHGCLPTTLSLPALGFPFRFLFPSVCVFAACAKDVPVLRHPARGHLPQVHLCDAGIRQERVCCEAEAKDDDGEGHAGREETDGGARADEGTNQVF